MTNSTTTATASNCAADGSAPTDLASAGAVPTPRTARHRWYRRLAPVLTVGVVVAAILGVRLATQHHAPQHAKPVSVAHPAALVPSNPAIEAAWGLRFTDVIVIADNGGVELRYQVLNEGVAAKIHQGDQSSNQLPTIVVQGSNAKITPTAVLMHIHHADSTAGQSYSIIYGNAGGAVHSGDFVTIVMKDGLKLGHVQVSD